MIWDNPTHRITLQSVASGSDTGAGVSLTYSTEQSNVPALINTASATERELFAQQGMICTHTIGLLASALTSIPERGWKVMTDDRSESFHVLGIRHGRRFMQIPSFVYLDCEQQLS
jgi:hypothetical protein